MALPNRKTLTHVKPRTWTRSNLSLRGAQRRGNLDEPEHTLTNRRCCGGGIAKLRSQCQIKAGTRECQTPIDEPDALRYIWPRRGNSFNSANHHPISGALDL